jgi:hypothetical protein
MGKRFKSKTDAKATKMASVKVCTDWKKTKYLNVLFNQNKKDRNA